MKLIVKLDGLSEKTKKTILRKLLYDWTEAETTNRHATRYQSKGALEKKRHTAGSLVHEHVLTRKSIVDDLMNRPSLLTRILEEAVACTVTIKDDEDLKDAAKKPKAQKRALNGWARYKAAGITVYDLSKKPPQEVGF